MDREVRRKDREISSQEAMELLNTAEYGILSTVGEDGIPYGMPISYAVFNNNIYVHCAKEGRKLQNIAHQPMVSFAVVGDTEPVVGNMDYSTYYESAVVAGKAYIVTEDSEKREGLTKIVEKYFPDNLGDMEEIINHNLDRTCVIAIPIEKITGKAKKKK